jgi:transposase-like protein
MADISPVACPHCQKSYLIQRHAVSVTNSGALTCPNCGQELTRWTGLYFCTLAVAPPRSNPEMSTIDEPPADS